MIHSKLLALFQPLYVEYETKRVPRTSTKTEVDYPLYVASNLERCFVIAFIFILLQARRSTPTGYLIVKTGKNRNATRTSLTNKNAA